MTHRQKLLAWLTERRSITPMEALRDLGIYRLGARVHELRQDGHRIETELLTVVGRDGERSHPARYHYKGAADASA